MTTVSCLTQHAPCLKNVPPLASYNFDISERILIFFGRNVANTVGNQKVLYYATEITCASALPAKTGKHENCIFHSNAVLVHQSLLDFFNVFDSRLILMVQYDSLNFVINVFSHRDCWGHGSGERKSTALQQLDCVARTKHQYAVF